MAGYEIEYFAVIDNKTPFSSVGELIDWFEGTLSANWNIAKEGRREFFTELAVRYLANCLQDCDEDGFVYFLCRRAEILAKIKQ